MQDIYDGVGPEHASALGQDYELKQGESAHDVVTVFSDGAPSRARCAAIVVVVFGTVRRLARAAGINGSLIVVGGNVTVQPGAAVSRDLVVIGGGLDAPPSFYPAASTSRLARRRSPTGCTLSFRG